ncbi:hypothetical protein OsI_21842 [Oryza sativa Indica Group]|uniref:Uncharacterized protein n=1 Tax=Oryza sativa subsp. indica TaxID=39946 RepID=B8B3I1_ORYSI|nr:hypothetical protein OsI_21842 [Oryza sativa Indica Group]
MLWRTPGGWRRAPLHRRLAATASGTDARRLAAEAIGQRRLRRGARNQERSELLPSLRSPLAAPSLLLADGSAKKARDPRRLRRSPEAMEKFHDGHLRVAADLRAGEYGSGVYLHQDRAAWTVHILHLDGGDILMLHSAANGRYLPAPRTGWSWNSVNLRDLNQLPSFTVGWFAVTVGSGFRIGHTEPRAAPQPCEVGTSQNACGRRSVAAAAVGASTTAVHRRRDRTSSPLLPLRSTRA